MGTTFSEKEVRLASLLLRERVINNLRLEPVASALLPILIREMRFLGVEIFGVDLVENWQSFEGATLKILDNHKLSDLIGEQRVGNTEKEFPTRLQFPFSYPAGDGNAELSLYLKNPQLDRVNWKNILGGSFGAVIEELEALTAEYRKQKREKGQNVLESTKQIMHVIEKIREKIQFAFAPREIQTPIREIQTPIREIQTPITIYEPRCRSMFYYTTKGLTAHIDDKTESEKRVNDFLKFVERVEENADYREFIKVTLEREDNPEIVELFDEMIQSFTEYPKEHRKDIFEKQRKKVERIMAYIPQESFSGLYSRLKEGETILWFDTDDFSYDLTEDDKKFSPCWSTVYPFERQYVGRRSKEGGNCIVKSGVLCPIYLFPGQFFGAVFAVSEDFNFDLSDYLKLYSLAEREFPNVRKALQNDFYQSVLESITGESELSEAILENIDKALKIVGVALWRFKNGEPELTKIRMYDIAAQYPKDNPISYFVRLVSREPNKDWKSKSSSIIDSIVQDQGESDKQGDYLDWDVVGEEELKDDSMKSHCDKLTEKLKKNRGGKPSDKINLKSALIIVRFEEDADVQYHPAVAYVFYFEETADVIRASAAEMVAVVDYAFGFSDIQEIARNEAAQSAAARAGELFIHSIRHAFSGYMTSAQAIGSMADGIVTSHVEAISAAKQIKSSVEALDGLLKFRERHVKYARVACRSSIPSDYIQGPTNIVEVINECYPAVVTEYYDNWSGREKDLWLDGKFVPPVLCLEQEGDKSLINVDYNRYREQNIWSFETLYPKLEKNFSKTDVIPSYTMDCFLSPLEGALSELFLNAMKHSPTVEIGLETGLRLSIKFVYVRLQSEPDGRLALWVGNRCEDFCKLVHDFENPLSTRTTGLLGLKLFFKCINRPNKPYEDCLRLRQDGNRVFFIAYLDPSFWRSLSSKGKC